MDSYTLKITTWLQNRAAEAEANDPTLASLKQRVRDATAVVTAAEGDDVGPALRAQSEAILVLMNYQSTKSH